MKPEAWTSNPSTLLLESKNVQPSRPTWRRIAASPNIAWSQHAQRLSKLAEHALLIVGLPLGKRARSQEVGSDPESGLHTHLPAPAA
jgi:hypothetical protein